MVQWQMWSGLCAGQAIQQTATGSFIGSYADGICQRTDCETYVCYPRLAFHSSRYTESSHRHRHSCSHSLSQLYQAKALIWCPCGTLADSLLRSVGCSPLFRMRHRLLRHLPRSGVVRLHIPAKTDRTGKSVGYVQQKLFQL